MLKTINTLLVVALMAALPAKSQAMDVTFGSWVSEVHAQGLNQYAGKELVAFYVSAREAVINGQGQALHLAALKTEPVHVMIGPDGKATVAKTFVPQTGLKAFNYLVFAIPTADNQGLYLKNFDGTYPADPRVQVSEWYHIDNQNFAYEHMWYISTLELKALQFSQGQNDFVNLDFTSRAVTTSAIALKKAVKARHASTSQRL